MAKHAKKTKSKGFRMFWLGISIWLLVTSFILSNTILNSNRAADQISQSSVSTKITNTVNQQLNSVTEGQIKVPKTMVEQLVHDKVKQVYTDGKIEFSQQDVRPKIEQLIKEKLPDVGILNWFSDKLAQQASPVLVTKLNQQIDNADTQRGAYQIYQARQVNQWFMWGMLVITILLGLFTLFTTNLLQLLTRVSLLCGFLLLLLGIGLSLGISWYLGNGSQQLLELTASVKTLFNMASYQMEITGGCLVLIGGVVLMIRRGLKSR
ncbi:hypothetical protein ACYATM_02665 [Lactobacillaceae bacterium Scapto_B20]